MNLQQAIVRQYLCQYVDDPAQLCIAFKAVVDNDNLSLYHQWVRPPAGGLFEYTKIHAIASPNKAERMKEEYRAIHDVELYTVGETYCVSSCAIGFARIGGYKEFQHENACELLKKKHSLKRYLQNYLGFEEGNELMLQHFLQINADKVDKETVQYNLDGNMPKAKREYIKHYLTLEGQDLQKFKEERVDECMAALAPVDQDVLQACMEEIICAPSVREAEKTLMKKTWEAIVDYKKCHDPFYKVVL